jgi:site-specific DNA-methyltransferase (adenine-specific)
MVQLISNPRAKIGCTEFKLIRGDCVVGMSRMAAECVDVVVTSPPYNLGIKYGKYDDHQVRDEYLKWSLEWASQVQRVLKDKGSFFLNVGGAPSNPLLPHQLILVMSKLFTLQNTFHWIKSVTVETRAGEQISVGHFKPISSHRYVTDCHEYVFHLTKTGNTPVDRLAIGVPYADKSNIKRWAHTGGGDKRCRGNNWFVPYKTIRSREEQRPHPATFPVELAEQCIKLHGAEVGLVVMDPFLGIGHSAVAARNCGVGKFIGFEIDGEYLAEAKEQVESFRVES